jgi:hypothetical protein
MTPNYLDEIRSEELTTFVTAVSSNTFANQTKTLLTLRETCSSSRRECEPVRCVVSMSLPTFLHRQDKEKWPYVRSSETSKMIYHTTRFHIP